MRSDGGMSRRSCVLRGRTEDAARREQGPTAAGPFLTLERRWTASPRGARGRGGSEPMISPEGGTASKGAREGAWAAGAGQSMNL